jgi:hypothetical protein
MPAKSTETGAADKPVMARRTVSPDAKALAAAITTGAESIASGLRAVADAITLTLASPELFTQDGDPLTVADGTARTAYALQHLARVLEGQPPAEQPDKPGDSVHGVQDLATFLAADGNCQQPGP